MKSLPSLHWNTHARVLISVLFLFSTHRILKINFTRFNLIMTSLLSDVLWKNESFSVVFIALCAIPFVPL